MHLRAEKQAQKTEPRSLNSVYKLYHRFVMLSRPAVIFSLQSHLRVTVQPEIHFEVQNYYFFFIYASARAFSIKKSAILRRRNLDIWIFFCIFGRRLARFVLCVILILRVGTRRV